MTYSSYSLKRLLDAFAAGEPVPGGGSAAALTGALGVSLLLMVAGLPKTRRGTAEEAADLAEASARLRPLREALEELVDRDSAAYQAVLAAYRQPKATGDEQTARRAAIAAAMQGATETPLETMRLCQQALDGAAIVLANGAASAVTDATVAVELLVAAVRGAALNVDVNARSMKDAASVARIDAERQALEADAAAAAERARAAAR